jgi:hypothetical protein
MEKECEASLEFVWAVGKTESDDGNSISTNLRISILTGRKTAFVG